MLKLTQKAKLYTLSIICIGFTIFGLGLNMIITSDSIYSILFFCLLSIITESLAIPVGQSSYISVSFAVGLIAILIYHPLISAVILSTGILFYVEYKNKKFYHIFNTSIYKRLFNGGSYSISALLAGYGYIWGVKLMPYAKLGIFNILGIFFATLLYIIGNIVICTILFSIIEKNHLVK